jgi:hypothetical protein
MCTLNKRTIGGIKLETIKVITPRPHWLLKLPNGEVLQSGAGGFDNSTRPRLWESVEYTLERLGQERFVSAFNL